MWPTRKSSWRNWSRAGGHERETVEARRVLEALQTLLRLARKHLHRVETVALPLLFPQWLSLMEPGEEQFVAECENDRADEQVDDPGREKSTYAAIGSLLEMAVST